MRDVSLLKCATPNLEEAPRERGPSGIYPTAPNQSHIIGTTKMWVADPGRAAHGTNGSITIARSLLGCGRPAGNWEQQSGSTYHAGTFKHGEPGPISHTESATISSSYANHFICIHDTGYEIPKRAVTSTETTEPMHGLPASLEGIPWERGFCDVHTMTPNQSPTLGIRITENRHSSLHDTMSVRGIERATLLDEKGVPDHSEYAPMHCWYPMSWRYGYTSLHWTSSGGHSGSRRSGADLSRGTSALNDEAPIGAAITRLEFVIPDNEALIDAAIARSESVTRR